MRTEDKIEEIVEFAINKRDVYSAIDSRVKYGMDYSFLIEEFKYMGLNTDVLSVMKTIERNM